MYGGGYCSKFVVRIFEDGDVVVFGDVLGDELCSGIV